MSKEAAYSPKLAASAVTHTELYQILHAQNQVMLTILKAINISAGEKEEVSSQIGIALKEYDSLRKKIQALLYEQAENG